MPANFLKVSINVERSQIECLSYKYIILSGWNVTFQVRKTWIILRFGILVLFCIACKQRLHDTLNNKEKIKQLHSLAFHIAHRTLHTAHTKTFTLTHSFTYFVSFCLNFRFVFFDNAFEYVIKRWSWRDSVQLNEFLFKLKRSSCENVHCFYVDQAQVFSWIDAYFIMFLGLKNTIGHFDAVGRPIGLFFIVVCVYKQSKMYDLSVYHAKSEWVRKRNVHGFMHTEIERFQRKPKRFYHISTIVHLIIIIDVSHRIWLEPRAIVTLSRALLP